MRTTLLALMLLLTTACAQEPVDRSTRGQPTMPSATGQPATPSAPGVAVVLTGVPVVDDDGAVQWCAHAGPGCPGVPVTGVDAGAVEGLEGAQQAWQVEGIYDGRRLAATGVPEPAPREPDADFATPCEDLRGEPGGGGNMDMAAVDAVVQYVSTIPERYAGQWWDSDAAVMTVLLTGDDVDEHRAALEDAVGERGTVCVVGGARWSEAELQQAQSRATEIATSAGLGLWSSSTDVVRNRVDLEVERSDEETRERIRREAGESVRVHAFIALRDAAIAELPAPPDRGDITLETADTRNAAGMDALGTFVIRFDPEQRCIYGEFGSERIGLIWPFGYYATSDPVQVLDADGRPVARPGDRVESGGGQGPREGPAACGADDVWAMNGPPTVVQPSETPLP